MKELVFHIGIPKTGSSALQVFLARNATLLATKSVDYLQIGEFALGKQGQISSGNGALLARSIFPKNAQARTKNPDKHVSEFFHSLSRSPADIGIVSSEMFIDVTTESFVPLIKRIADLGVKSRVFYYVRSQTQFMSSAYIQQVKRHHYTKSPSDYIQSSYKHIHFLRYNTLYEKLSEIFGPSNVECRTYDAAVQARSGILHAFLNALPVNPEGLSFETNDVNTGLPAKQIAIMRALNNFSPRMNFSDVVVENAANTGAVESGQIHNILSDELISEINEFFFAENRQFATSYFKRPALFPPTTRFDAPETISIDELSNNDLIMFFGGLLVRYDDRIARLEAALSTVAR